MSPTSSVSSPKELEDWINTAAAGDAIIYHVGPHTSGNLCRFAMRMSEEGYIALVQRRVLVNGVALFQFEAQRTKNRRRR